MQGQQLELWKSKKGVNFPTPPTYQELTPDQRRRLIKRLARLILKQVQSDTNIANTDNHER